MEQSSTTTPKKTTPPQLKIKYVSCKVTIDMKTRKESSLRSDRFQLEFYNPIGIIVRDISRDCFTIVPYSNINYIQVEE